MGKMRVWSVAATAVALVGASSCYDFAKDRQACEDAGRCERPDSGTTTPDQDAGEDAGLADSGQDAGLDGGRDAGGEPPDAGPLGCDGGFEFTGQVQTGAWIWENPLPQGNPLTAISGSGASVWIGGNSGTLMRFDGCIGRQIPLPTSKGVNDIAALKLDDIYVVGDPGVAFRLDGGSVAPILENSIFLNQKIDEVTASEGVVLFGRALPTNPSLVVQPVGGQADPVNGPNGGGILAGTSAASKWWVLGVDQNIYASNGLLQDPEPWDPRPHPPLGDLRDLWAGAKGEVWAVGAWGTVLRFDEGNLRQVGTAADFSLGDGGAIADFVSISGADSTTASRDIRVFVGPEGALFHGGWESQNYVALPAGAAAQRTIDFNRVWVRPYEQSGPSEIGGTVWAVAQGGEIITNLHGPWKDIRAQLTPTSARGALNDIHGEGDGLFALGGGRVLRRIGPASKPRWEKFTPEPPPGYTLQGLAVLRTLPDVHLLAVGNNTGLLEFVGGKWEERGYKAADGRPAGVPGQAELQVRSIHSPNTGVAWAVGSRFDGSTQQPWVGLWNVATGWAEVPSASNVPPLTAVSSASVTEAWAVGGDQVVKIIPTVATLHLSLPGTLHAIHANAMGGIYVGGEGLIATVLPMNIAVAQVAGGGNLMNQVFHDVTPSPDGPLFVGAAGRAYVLDAGTVYPIEPGTTNHLRGVFVDKYKEVYAVGDNNTVLRLK